MGYGKKMRKMRKETGNYVFPKTLADAMKGISQRTQYEASMLAITFILLGSYSQRQERKDIIFRKFFEHSPQ